MSSNYKYQTEFSQELTDVWLAGGREQVRLTIRQLKNKSQAAYIAAKIAVNISERFRHETGGAFRYEADIFAEFMHPNNGRAA